MQFGSDVQNAIDTAAASAGVDPNIMRAIAGIESSGNPNARTGSYQGLFQLSPDEFYKYAGSGGNITDPYQNANAAANKISDESSRFQSKFGRAPTASEIYLMHQQGDSGAVAHMQNPDGIAWQNVRPFYTDEAARRKGFASGDDYARAAIWGNVPDNLKAQYGSVDNMTSGQFMNMWQNKMASHGAGGAPVQTADATPPASTPNAGMTGTQSGAAATPAQPAPVQVASAGPQNSSQSGPLGGLGSVLGYLANQNSSAPTAQTSGTLGDAAATVGTDSNGIMQAVMKANQAAQAANDIQPAAGVMPKVDLSKLMAAIQARRGIV